ncbi:hypothetical protein K2X33_01280 [bacterium]|nr:hypothetical protein [bacterium]
MTILFKHWFFIHFAFAVAPPPAVDHTGLPATKPGASGPTRGTSDAVAAVPAELSKLVTDPAFTKAVSEKFPDNEVTPAALLKNWSEHSKTFRPEQAALALAALELGGASALGVYDPKLCAEASPYAAKMAKAGSQDDHAGFQERFGRLTKDAKLNRASEITAVSKAGLGDSLMENARSCIASWRTSYENTRDLGSFHTHFCFDMSRSKDGIYYCVGLFGDKVSHGVVVTAAGAQPPVQASQPKPEAETEKAPKAIFPAKQIAMESAPSRETNVQPASSAAPKVTLPETSPVVISAPMASRPLADAQLKPLLKPALKYQQRPGESPILADVATHSAKGLLRYSNQSTAAHETVHQINSENREYPANRHMVPGKNGWSSNYSNYFYLGDGQGVLIQEADGTDKGLFQKAHVAEYVPKSLRDHRYGLYVVGMRNWNDRPSYLLDELAAYTIGAETAVELIRAGKWRESGNIDEVKGAMEFVTYGIAMLQANRDYYARGGRNLFEEKPELVQVVRHLSERAVKVFREGNQIRNFQGFGQQQLWENFKNSPDAQGLRDFADEAFGKGWFARLIQQ